MNVISIPTGCILCFSIHPPHTALRLYGVNNKESSLRDFFPIIRQFGVRISH